MFRHNFVLFGRLFDRTRPAFCWIYLCWIYRGHIPRSTVAFTLRNSAGDNSPLFRNRLSRSSSSTTGDASAVALRVLLLSALKLCAGDVSPSVVLSVSLSLDLARSCRLPYPVPGACGGERANPKLCWCC